MEDEDGYAVVQRYRDEQRALADAKVLVSSGIGADVEAGRHSFAEDADPVEAFELRVVGTNLVRACELLDVTLDAEDEPEPPKPPWKAIIAIWMIAMLVIPLLAFWLTVRIAS